MNERIQELLVEAHRQTKGGIYNGHLSEWSEKFAELIVEECRYVMDCNKGSDQHTEWNRALFETSEKIKEHFGVEE